MSVDRDTNMCVCVSPVKHFNTAETLYIKKKERKADKVLREVNRKWKQRADGK